MLREEEEKGEEKSVIEAGEMEVRLVWVARGDC